MCVCLHLMSFCLLYIGRFAIPFTMATTLGLSARALDLPITLAEANQGLVPPAVATHLLGTAGSSVILVQLFMAVTASSASEQIAVATVLSFDIFKRYLSPRASGRQVSSSNFQCFISSHGLTFNTFLPFHSHPIRKFPCLCLVYCACLKFRRVHFRFVKVDIPLLFKVLD